MVPTRTRATDPDIGVEPGKAEALLPMMPAPLSEIAAAVGRDAAAIGARDPAGP